MYKILFCLVSKKINPGTLKDIERQLIIYGVTQGNDTYSFLIKLTKFSVISLFKGSTDDGSITDGIKFINGQSFPTYYIDRIVLRKLWMKTIQYKLSTEITKFKLRKMDEKNEGTEWWKPWIEGFIDIE